MRKHADYQPIIQVDSMALLILLVITSLIVSIEGDFCPQPVTRTVSCKVRNGTETFTKMVPRPCNRRWPNNNEVNCGMEAKIKERPKLVTTFKTITELQYRCCPGYFGENCDMECFNCTTLERMERRIRIVEESIRNNGSYFGSNFRPIRPGKPDVSHVSNGASNGATPSSRKTNGGTRRPFNGYDDVKPDTADAASPPAACSCPAGPPGPPGLRGDHGLPGIPGLAGSNGMDGIPGAAGLQGLPGPVGAPGAPGIDGLPGADGVQGIAGLQGLPGAPGAPGLNGETGAPGPIGAVGPQGEAGAPGLQGIDGAPGAPGPEGLIGPVGPPGSPGSPGLPGPPGPPGPPGLVSLSRTNDGSGFDDDEDSKMSKNPIPGPPGPEGPQGAEGPQGLAGPIGPTGPQGPSGPPGPPGLPGPPGERGHKGDKGDIGLTGEKGDLGDRGFPGVRGPPGDTGLAGLPGPKGDKGDTDSVELSASILQLHQIIDVLREQIRDLQDRVSILEVRSGDSLPSEPVVVPTTAPVISAPIEQPVIPQTPPPLIPTPPPPSSPVDNDYEESHEDYDEDGGDLEDHHDAAPIAPAGTPAPAHGVRPTTETAQPTVPNVPVDIDSDIDDEYDPDLLTDPVTNNQPSPVVPEAAVPAAGSNNGLEEVEDEDDEPDEDDEYDYFDGPNGSDYPAGNSAARSKRKSHTRHVPSAQPKMSRHKKIKNTTHKKWQKN